MAHCIIFKNYDFYLAWVNGSNWDNSQTWWYDILTLIN